MAEKNSKNNKKNAAANTTVTGTRTVMSAEEFGKKVQCTTVGNSRRDDGKFWYTDLQGLRIENQSLNNAEFNSCCISDTVFCGVELECAEFKFAELNNVVFQNCKMENSHWDFAKFNNVHFVNCTLESANWDFVSGEAVFENSQLKYGEFPSAALKLIMKNCSAYRTEFNGCQNLSFLAENCNFNRAEFNDSVLTGKMVSCCLSDAEFNAGNGMAIEFNNCVVRGIETRGSIGFDFANGDEEDDGDDDLEKAFEELEEGVLDD